MARLGGGGGGGREVPAAYCPKTINDSEMKFAAAVKDHKLINFLWFNWRITSSLHYDDVITVQIFLVFSKFSAIKGVKFRELGK